MNRVLLFLFFLATLFTLQTECRAETISPYKGTEAGTLSQVYLYNVSTGMFLQTNRRDPSFWTTRAQLDVSGKDLDISTVNGGYQINPKLGANHSLNDFNLYCDTSQPVTAWVFTPIDTDNGMLCYTITSGNYTLGAGKTNGKDGKPLITNLSSNMAEGGDLWQIVTTYERLQVLKTATQDHPQDASWMIKGFDFAANDERNTAWNGLNGDHAIVADNKVSCNRLLECWNLSEADVYQEIKVPNGIYQVWANGCYSPTGAAELNTTHLNAYEQGTEPVCGYIYANEEQMPMIDIYAEKQTAKVTNCMEKQIGSYWIPAGNGQVSGSFFNGYYRPEPFYISVVDEKIRIGAKVIGGTGTSWILVDNFTLTYLGNDGSAFKGHITPTPANGTYIDFDDMASLSLRMDGATAVTLDNTCSLTLTIKGSEGEVLAHADCSNTTVERNTVTITPVFDAINYGGEATVCVEGTILVDGETFIIGTAEAPFTFTWKVKAKVLPYIPPFTISPDTADVVRKGQLGFITITFPEAASMSFDIDALATIYSTTTADGHSAGETHAAVSDAFFSDWQQNGNAITMTFRQLPQTFRQRCDKTHGRGVYPGKLRYMVLALHVGIAEYNILFSRHLRASPSM